MLSGVLWVIAIVAMVILSIVFLQKPLEEKGLEGAVSIVIRVVIGVVAGFAVGFLLQM
jgi:hypothetical protein